MVFRKVTQRIIERKTKTKKNYRNKKKMDDIEVECERKKERRHYKFTKNVKERKKERKNNC